LIIGQPLLYATLYLSSTALGLPSSFGFLYELYGEEGNHHIFHFLFYSSSSRDDEYLKFVPHTMSYQVVPGSEFQCKKANYSSRKLSTIDEQDDDAANRRGMMHQVGLNAIDS